jgi:peptide/nickel transport system permease protein
MGDFSQYSILKESWLRFRSQSFSFYSLIGIAAMFLIAVYAPLFVGSAPLVIIGDNFKISFPFAYTLFNPDGPELLLDKIYNYLIFLIPVFLLFCIVRFRKRYFFILALIMMIPFLWKWHISYRWNEEEHIRSKSNSSAVYPLVQFTPYEISGAPYEAPSWNHFLGTDGIGRDVMARIIFGARISLAVGFFATLISFMIGTAMGLASGYFGGWTDILIMRFVEIFICFPAFLLLLILTASMMDLKFEQSGLILIPVIGILSWTPFARIVRGETLKQRALPYIQSCHVFGMSNMRIMFIHILPNILGPIIVTIIFSIASNILAESSLSFLGFGVQSPTASWGELLKQAFSDPLRYWNLTLWPGLMIFLSIFLLNLIGEGVRKSIGD